MRGGRVRLGLRGRTGEGSMEEVAIGDRGGRSPQVEKNVQAKYKCRGPSYLEVVMGPSVARTQGAWDRAWRKDHWSAILEGAEWVLHMKEGVQLWQNIEPAGAKCCQCF